MALTPKQEKFCQEYKKCGVQIEAFKKAFDCKNMKAETIAKRASELMKKGEIRGRLSELQEKIEKKAVADAQEIQETLTRLLRGEIKEECVVVESVGDYQSQATIVKKQVTPKDRIKAGELLSKLRGDFNINVNITEIPIIKDDI